MVNFSNGYLIHATNCDSEICNLIRVNAFSEILSNNMQFYKIATSSITEPFDLWAILAFNSQVTERYLIRMLQLPPNSNIAIANAEYWFDNLSQSLHVYDEGGSLINYTHQSSHSNPNDNNILSSGSSSSVESYSGSDSEFDSENDSVETQFTEDSEEDIQIPEDTIQYAEQNMLDNFEEYQEPFENQNIVDLIDIDDISFDEVEAMQAVDAQLLPHSMRNIT
jgi:hypothetical protein